MAVRTPPSWLQAGSHAAENDRLILSGLVGSSGVTRPNDLVVTQTGTPSMAVVVGSGGCFIPGTVRASQGTYHAYNDSPVTLTVPTSNGSNPRFDLVIMRIYDADVAGSLNQATLEIVAGTASGSPVEPSIPANSIVLARISVGTGVSSISASNIVDRRAFMRLTSARQAMTSTQRLALTATSVYPGMEVFETNTLGIYVWTGTAWVQTNRKSLFGTNVGSANISTSAQNFATLTLPAGQWQLKGECQLDYAIGAAFREYTVRLSSAGSTATYVTTAHKAQNTQGKAYIHLEKNLDIATSGVVALQAFMSDTGGLSYIYTLSLWADPISF